MNDSTTEIFKEIAARNKKLKGFITCLKCERNGHECSINCPNQYEVGNMGSIIENLEIISKVLDAINILDK